MQAVATEIIECQCAKRGMCPVFNRKQSARDVQICKCEGANKSVERTASMQQQWARDGSPLEFDALLDLYPRTTPLTNETDAVVCSSCSDAKPAGPLKRAAGLVKAAFGWDRADVVQLELRLDECSRCDQHMLGKCKACSCWVAAKAAVSSEQCPLGKWQKPRRITAPTQLNWQGNATIKPWEYRCQLVIPHINTPEPVELAVEMWKAQTVEPYICIVDTGSTPANLDRIKALQCDSVEVHEVRCRGWRHPSQPVAAAQDIATAVCQSDYQLCTHSDVFPMRQDVIEELLSTCGAKHPVVGYQLSPRDDVDGELSQLWRGMVGHTLTMLFMPTIRGAGITWNMERVHDEFGFAREPLGNNDTEVAFNLQLRELGIEPLLIGDDVNHQRQVTKHFDHCRSHASTQLYDAAKGELTNDWIAAALADGRKRLETWNNER